MEDVQDQLAKKAKGRQQFKYQDRVVYEWDQNLEDCNIYIDLPPVFRPKQREQMKKQLQPGQTLPELQVKIEVNKLTVGIKGNPPFLEEKLGGMVKTDESYWMIEDDELHVQLCKMKITFIIESPSSLGNWTITFPDTSEIRALSMQHNQMKFTRIAKMTQTMHGLQKASLRPRGGGAYNPLS